MGCLWYTGVPLTAVQLPSTPVAAGQIFKILVPELSSHTIHQDAVVIVEHFEIHERPDLRLNMPILVSSNRTYIIRPCVRCQSLPAYLTH